MQGIRRSQGFRQQIAKPVYLGPEHHAWYWHPSRIGVKLGPEDFRKKLKDLGQELDVTWNPIKERWQIWSLAPKIQHKICWGWKLLFVVHDGQGGYAPLDERVLARLYHASVLSSGSAKEYFNRVVSEMERDKASREKQLHNDLIDSSMPSFDHSQIKVSGFGPSNGSKFATYHQ
jgi:hypothetical protein